MSSTSRRHAEHRPDPAAARAGERMAMLREMAEIGLRLARSLEREAEAAVVPEPASDAAEPRSLEEITRSFAQVARAVSLAVALEEKIDADLQARPFAAQSFELKRRAVTVRVAEAQWSSTLARRRAQVCAAVEQAIEADPDAGDPRRAADLRVRLDRLLAIETADHDRFLHRPAGEVVARICRDLGLAPDWTLWDAPWAHEAERSEAAAPLRPGEPRAFAQRRTSAPPEPSSLHERVDPRSRRRSGGG